MIYLFMFALTCVTFGLGTKSHPTNYFLIFVSVLLLALLAGFRDFTIGTDIQLYGIYVFENVKNYNSIIDLVFNNTVNIELGYALVAYISSFLSPNPHFFFFLVGLINYSLIALAICKYNGSISPTMSWFLFLCLYFSDTFNIMRQTISLSIFLIGFDYLTNKDYKKVFFCAGFAILFHTTAIIGIIIYLIYYFLNKSSSNISNITFVFISIAFVITLILPYIIPIMINIGFLPEIYNRYVGGGGLKLSLNSVIIRVIPLFIFLIFKNNLKKQNDYYFLLLMLILDIFVCNLSTVNATFERISLWFGYFRIFAYSKIVSQNITKRIQNRIILKIFLIIYGITIFYYQVIIMGGNQIFPYASEILGI